MPPPPPHPTCPGLTGLCFCCVRFLLQAGVGTGGSLRGGDKAEFDGRQGSGRGASFSGSDKEGRPNGAGTPLATSPFYLSRVRCLPTTPFLCGPFPFL